jgi:hypothetical protein
MQNPVDAIEDLKGAGFDEDRAKALVRLVADRDSDLVTKDYLRSELSVLKGEIGDVKSDIREIRSLIKQIERLLLFAIGGIVILYFKSFLP